MALANVGRGHKFFIQFGKEATYGTGVAATGLRLFGFNFKAKPMLGVEEEDALIGGIESEREVYQLGRFWEWSFEVDLNYVGQLKFWNMICGDGTSPTTPSVTGPDGNGIYTHTFKEGETMPAFTGEVWEGGVAAATTVSQFEGMQLEKIEVSGEGGQSQAARLRAKLSGIARNRANSTTVAAALTMANPRAVQYRHATIVDDGSADAAADVLVHGWKFTIESALTRDRFPFGNTPYLSHPIRDKKVRAMMEFTQEWQTMTQYGNFASNLDNSPAMEFTGPELVGAAGARSIKFELPKSRIIDLEPPVDKWGRLMTTIQHLGLYSSGDQSSFIVTVKTDQATIALG